MKKTPNAVVLGGSVRFPLTTNSSILCLKYWLKFFERLRSVRKCYNYMLNTKTKLSVNWGLEIKRISCKDNCEFAWLAKHVIIVLLRN